MRQRFNLLFTFSLFLFLTSCVSDSFKERQQLLQQQADELVKLCNNYSSIEVNLTSNVDGKYCSVYTENPYNQEGALQGAPILEGITPIRTSLEIGSHVDKLYILTGNNLIEHDVADVNLNLSNTTKAIVEQSTIPDGLSVDFYFPEKKFSVSGENLYLNTDLMIKTNTGLRITYISDGLPVDSNHKIEALLWLYTYPSTLTEPKIEDCTFYGIDPTTGDLLNIGACPALLPKNGDLDFARPFPKDYQTFIFDNVAEKASGKHKQIDLGRFDAGVNIGFMFMGIYAVRTAEKNISHYSFTTPSLNDQAHSLNKTAVNDKAFVYKKPVSQGFFVKIQYDGKYYYALGMENSLPDGSSYDADFNDILCLIEADPDDLDCVSYLPDRELNPYKQISGYYLFEDNYPDKGDYDFNDVVIRYEIKTFLNRTANDSKRNLVRAALVAHGCSFANEFGFHVGNKDDMSENTFFPFFTNIHGYVNVDEWANDEEIKVFEQYFPGNVSGASEPDGAPVRPYLKNANGVIYNNSYGRDGIDYPYVLDVPLTSNAYNYSQNFNYTVEAEAGNDFRWCKEKQPLTDAYKSTPKTIRWYTKGYKNESLLVKRK